MGWSGATWEIVGTYRSATNTLQFPLWAFQNGKDPNEAPCDQGTDQDADHGKEMGSKEVEGIEEHESHSAPCEQHQDGTDQGDDGVS